MTWLAAHLKELIHDGIHLVFMPAAVWLWNERRVLKEVLEDGLERRHENKGDPMINPLTILQDITTVSQAVAKIQAAVPQVLKIVSDIKQAQADQKNPVALTADLTTILADIQADLTLIASLVPPATPAPVPPAAALAPSF